MVIMGLKFPSFRRYIKGMATTFDRPGKIKCFLEGFSSVFDITGKAFTTEENGNDLSGFQKDYLAMRGDWQNLGNDMRKAIDQEKAVNRVFYGG